MACFTLLDSIESFSGEHDALDVCQWIQQIEDAEVLAKWNKPQVCVIARLKMRGAARDFLSSDPELNTMENWEKFKEKIVDRFHVRETTIMLTQKLSSSTQQIGESARAFAARLQRIANKLNESRGEPADIAERDMRRRIIASDVRAQFLKGLSSDIRSMVRVQARDSVKIEELVSIATLEEQAREKNHGDNGGGQLAAIYEDGPVSAETKEEERRERFFCHNRDQDY